ncbi:hypothetical protein GCM10009784_08030 [Arthrobacter parietis]|uniref:Radical SAM core domain-containing protein n=2 Tax=Arthrobacter parietis TaxID=271434 RepID=A0ABN3AQQ8_9MICC
MVFTGGDPSLRKDLSQLITYAKSFGMFVEVLTNAHHRPDELAAVLSEADLVGVSLDGATADIHDQFRNKKDNFKRVNRLLDLLDSQGKPYIVRTIISAENAASIPAMADAMHSRKMLTRWGIQQFSPVEEGYVNRDRYAISDVEYRSVVSVLMNSASQELKPKISTLSVDDRIGLYLLLNPAGAVFGRDHSTEDGTFPTVGSVFTDHLFDLSEALSFDRGKHELRYANWFKQDSR